MLSERAERRPELSSSILNLFGDLSTYYTASWFLGRFVDAITEAGYNGLEFHPLRVPTTEILWGLAGSKVEAIKSFHQSFHSPRNLSELRARLEKEAPFKKFQIVAEHVLLVSQYDSLEVLARVQEKLGGKIPIVLYPDREPDPGIAGLPFAEKLIQPYPGIMEELGVGSIDELLVKIKGGGYTGFALDLHHFRVDGPSGLSLNPWQETLPKLLEHSKELHVAVGRVDFQSDKEKTLSELKDITDNTRRTEMSQMLMAIRDSEWNGLIVTEIPASAVTALVYGQNSKGKILHEQQWIDFHKKIVRGIADLLSR